MDNQPAGVLSRSESFFCTPSSLAKRMLFYQLYCGHFYCSREYDTKREDFGCYLLMYVAVGECFVRTPRRAFTAGPGEVFFIDCHQPHEYGCTMDSELYWLHFDGTDAAAFFTAIAQSHGELFCREESVGMGVFLRENVEFFRSYGRSHSNGEPDAPDIPAVGEPEGPPPWNPMGEIAFSSRFYQELCSFLACNPPVRPDEENVINQAVSYLCQHYAEPLTVELLAENAHVSTAYFSRLFKKRMGSSPYEYLIRHRIDQAKYLLRYTDRSIEEVAYAAGFGSAANFIYTFSRRTGMPPGKFRRMRF